MGIRNQNGQSLFHYDFAITTHAASFNPVEAMKFSLSELNQLVTGWVAGNSGSSLNSFSLVHVSDPGVLLWSIKPCEDYTKQGLSVRFWNLNSTSVSPRVSFFKPVAGCWHSTHIETDFKTIKIWRGFPRVTFKGKQVATYKVAL